VVEYYKIEIPEFPSHVISRKRKTKPDKYEKINYNKIYSGNLHHFDRGNMIIEMHKFLDDYIPYQLDIKLPIVVDVTMVVPLNWGEIQRRNSKIIWKTPKADYNPDWDVFNAVDVWRKVIEDVLTAHNIYPDDNCMWLRGGSGKVEFCETYDERKMIIELKSI
jgi:hypothetical protein